MHDMLDRALSPICHRDPERSFFLAGQGVMLCARCMGLYIGAAMEGLVLIAGRLLRVQALSLSVALVCLAGVCATPAELVLEKIDPSFGSNLLRFGLGYLTGASLTALLWLPHRGLQRDLRIGAFLTQAAVLPFLGACFFLLGIRGRYSAAGPVLSTAAILGVVVLASSVLFVGIGIPVGWYRKGKNNVW